jgi:hypothetical protein
MFNYLMTQDKPTEPQDNKMLNRMALILHFPFYYTSVTNQSRFKAISVKELKSLSEKSQLNAEFLAAFGLSEIDFSPLKEALPVVDNYLKTGALNRDEIDRLLNAFRPIGLIHQEIVADFKNAGKSHANGVGAPMMFFAYLHAICILQACIVLDEDFDIEENTKVRERLDKIKRIDPDDDRRLQIA